MKTLCLAVVATLIAGTASADIPLFAATWPTHITVDSSAKEQVDGNGKVEAARLRENPPASQTD